MGQDVVVSLTTHALEVALLVALPILLVALTVGLVVSIFQAMTQIQEQTLSFIPKILVVAAVMALGGPWMLNTLLLYTQNLFLGIPQLVGP